MNFMTFHMLGLIIIPTDEVIFFRGVGIPPTSVSLWEYQWEYSFGNMLFGEHGNIMRITESRILTDTTGGQGHRSSLRGATVVVISGDTKAILNCKVEPRKGSWWRVEGATEVIMTSNGS